MNTISFVHGWCIITVLVITDTSIAPTPPDFCLQTLNTSDCGGKPTDVAYYYKPGSRCDVAVWRGCPTANKFPDEFICSHICIAKLKHWSSEETIESTDETPSNETEAVNGTQDFLKWQMALEALLPDDMDAMDDLIKIALDENPPTPNKVPLNYQNTEDQNIIQQNSSETNNHETVQNENANSQAPESETNNSDTESTTEPPVQQTNAEEEAISEPETIDAANNSGSTTEAETATETATESATETATEIATETVTETATEITTEAETTTTSNADWEAEGVITP